MLDLTTADFTTVTNGTLLLSSLVSIVLGVIIAASFNFRNKKSRGFLMTLSVLPFIVQIVIMLVNGNVGTGVAVMGAFSLVRFRSVPGNAKDICSIFLAMAVGLATGTMHLILASLAVIVVCALNIVFTLIPENNASGTEKELTVLIPESLDYASVFDDIFENYTTQNELTQVKTVNMGSLYKLKYTIKLKDKTKEKEMLDEIRVRNGNLEVICSRAKEIEGEQL
ncbi:DUF4956 domain-containing protein [Ruminococcus sp. FC2018]|uniref:DUF4956 domain-containing protein n=1 Tax=Ruminococcus sp. FC2018 TaxID=1410617 RepID=UPI000A733CD3|nr:DUF4956 domain-containing protein [Ruminococcus sp. FC2018]